MPNPKGTLSPLGVRRARKTSPGRQLPPVKQDSPPPPPRQRSPGRSKSPGRPKSPSRTKSPSRKPKQSPSPSREKSTRKKSPSKVLKLEVEKLILEKPITFDKIEKPDFPRRRKAVEHDSASSLKDINGSGDSNSIKPPIISDITLNSSKVIHLKSDYESSAVEPDEKSLKHDGKIKTEFGGWPGALISMLIFPVGIFTLNHMCNKNACDWKLFPKISLKPETYFNQNVSLLFFAYITFMALLSLIPYVGRKVSISSVSRDGKRVYKMNGLFSLFMTIMATALLEFYKFPVLQLLRERYMQFCVLSLILGVIMSIAMFIHSRYVPISEQNTHGNTGNFIYDMFMGRTTNPRIFRIDMKLLALRTSLISIVSINNLFYYSFLKNNGFVRVS